MRKKIRVGVPRAFLYYRYYVFWKCFLEMIGCQVVLSPETNKEIVQNGKNLSIDESCLPSKIYLGHVDYLKDKCDYILVPRISNYGKEKRVCMKFLGIVDVVCNVFPNVRILDYNIDYLKGKFEFISIFKLATKFNKNIFRILWAYFLGKKKEKKYNESLANRQFKILKSNNLKILIVSHPYVIHDRYLGGTILDYLKKMEVDILFSDRLDRKEATCYSKDFSKTLYWLYSKESIGGALYYKDAVDGIIFVSSFPCGPDSLVNELAIRKLKNIPIINIIVDESTAEAGLETRLESFIDMIKARDN